MSSPKLPRTNKMIIPRMIFYLLIFILSIHCCGFSQTWEELEGRRDLDFNIYLDKSEYLVDEPIYVHYMIENHTSQLICAAIPQQNILSKVYITNERGDTIPYEHLILPEMLIPPHEVPYLRPGQFYYVLRDVNYQLLPGEYTLQILYPATSWFYRRHYQKGNWKNKQEFDNEIHRIGDKLSNKLHFKVVSPESNIDKKTHEILKEAYLLISRNGMSEQSMEKFAELIEKFPKHPYTQIAHEHYLSILSSKKSRELQNSFELMSIDTFPNTILAQKLIHIKSRHMEKNERKQYFHELKNRFKGQWVEKYINCLDYRLGLAE